MCFGAYTLTPHLFSSLGVLACLDGYMNIAMEQTEEFVDGQLKAKFNHSALHFGSKAKMSKKEMT